MTCARPPFIICSMGRSVRHLLLKAIVFAAFLSVGAAAGPIDDARALISQGRIPEARQILLQLREQIARDPEIIVLLAQLEPDGARSQELYREALSLAPEEMTAPKAILGIADFYYARGFYANAHRMALQVVDVFPDSPLAPWASLLIGRCLDAAGQHDDAAETLRQLFTSHDADLRLAAAAAWARATLHSNQPREVIAAFAGTEWEGFPELQSLLSQAYRAAGQRSLGQSKAWAASAAERAWAAPPLATDSGRPSVPTSAPPRTEQPARQPEERRQTPTEQSAAQEPGTDANSFTGEHRGFSLQVGAFGNEENAMRMRDRLRAEGIESIIHRTGRLHRVWAGNYATRDEARGDIERVQGIADLRPVIVRNR